MATHKINMSIPSKMVINSDVEFDIFSDDKKLGTLKVSKGTLDWVPANWSNHIQVSWEKFDELLKEFYNR